MIVEKTITEPNEVNEFYASLPESNLTAIERRDNQQ